MAIHGKNAHVAIDDKTGALTDISQYGKDSTLSRSVDTADSSHFGSTDKTYVVGQSDATFTVSGFFDATQDALVSAVYDAQNNGTIPVPGTITVVYGPGGAADGAVGFTQEAIMTGYDVTAAVGDLVGISLTFQRTGPTGRGTFAGGTLTVTETS